MESGGQDAGIPVTEQLERDSSPSLDVVETDDTGAAPNEPPPAPRSLIAKRATRSKGAPSTTVNPTAVNRPKRAAAIEGAKKRRAEAAAFHEMSADLEVVDTPTDSALRVPKKASAGSRKRSAKEIAGAPIVVCPHDH